MFKNIKNQVGDINGDYNQVIQIILSDGEKIVEKLGVLISRVVKEEKQEIDTLHKLIEAKEESLKDKRKVVEVQDIEMIRLKTVLSQKNKELEESEKRFEKLYIDNNGKDFSGSQEMYPKALKLLIEGNKEEALKILERSRLLEQKRKLDKEKEQQSASWLLRAQLLKDKDNWGDELNECYDYAAEIFSNWGNNLEVANHYKFINVIEKAEYYYQVCLQKTSSEYEKAITLNNLAILQRSKREFEKAEISYKEALETYRGLAKTNSQTYLFYVATTLNNLGNFQSDKNEFEKAELSYKEALEVYRELAKTNYQTYLPDVATTLNNLGNLESDKNEFEKAETSYKEALDIRRELAKTNPQAYLFYVATTLNNWGNLQNKKNELEKSEASHKEASVIYQKLAITNPQTYLPDVAMTLNNLSNIQVKKNELEKAEVSYKEALEIYRGLVAINLQTYLPNIGITLNNLAALQTKKNKFEKVERYYKEALEILKELSKINPQTYLPHVAMTQINMSIYYQESSINKDLSIQLVDEAITNLLPFSHIPYIQNYLKVAFSILQKWGIDVEAYLKEKDAD